MMTNNYIRLLISLLILFTNIFTFNLTNEEITSDNFEIKLKNILIKFNSRNEKYETRDNGTSIIYKNKCNLSFEEQFDNDIVMIYKTLFPETERFANFISNNETFTKIISRLNLKIITSLKKILFSLFDLGLYYSYDENAVFNYKNLTEENLWPHPLASIICHGGRTIFLINKSKFNGTDIMEYFFEKNNSLLYNRGASSHKVEASDKKVYEKKIILEAAWDWIKSLVDTKLSPHYAMNIPIGGIGNYWPNGNFTIFNQGYADKGQNGDKLDNHALQHGHLFVRYDTLEKYNYSSIMLGFEEAAPYFKDMFSDGVHNFLSAFFSTSSSVCGGSKWKSMEKELKSKIPNNYGGKAVFFDKLFDETLLHKIENLEENYKKKIWWIILSLNSIESKKFKENYLNSNETLLKNELDKLDQHK